VSGSVLEVDREAAAAAGADAFLGKPYSPSALTALLAMFSERLRQDEVAVES
jgi:CheY-like chemotaxis protein